MNLAIVESALALTYRERIRPLEEVRTEMEEDLTPREERIFRLLEYTVLPCTDLLIAATLLHSGQAQEAESLVEPIRQAAYERTLSYRVYYNLACYTVGRAKAGQPSTAPVDGALQAIALLRKSFRLARDPRKGQLVEWARDDPSLELLRSHPAFKPRFDALLAEHAAPRPQKNDEKSPQLLEGF